MSAKHVEETLFLKFRYTDSFAVFHKVDNLLFCRNVKWFALFVKLSTIVVLKDSSPSQCRSMVRLDVGNNGKSHDKAGLQWCMTFCYTRICLLVSHFLYNCCFCTEVKRIHFTINGPWWDSNMGTGHYTENMDASSIMELEKNGYDLHAIGIICKDKATIWSGKKRVVTVISISKICVKLRIPLFLNDESFVHSWVLWTCFSLSSVVTDTKTTKQTDSLWASSV